MSKKIVLMVLVLLVSSFALLSAQTRGMVGGYVTKDAGTSFPPVVGATVEVYLVPTNTNFAPELIDETTTDSSGWYQVTINPAWYPVGGNGGYSHVLVKCRTKQGSAAYTPGTIQINLFFGQEL